MKKNILSFISIFAITFCLQAQKDVVLTVKHMLGDSPFAFNQEANNDLGESFQITRIDYYLSQFTLIHDGGQETSVNSDVYILAKGSNNVEADLGSYDVENIEGIKFHIGVEAPTNNDDPSLWASGHPLGPQAPSMHWGWSPGYRFVAIEGLAGESMTTGFEMHGLFNANYFSQTIMLEGVNSDNQVYINLDADYSEALRGINVESGPIAHGVNGEDLTVLENFRDYVFSPGDGFPSSISSIELSDFKVYPNPSNGIINISLSNKNLIGGLLTIYSIEGKIISQNQVSLENNIDLNLDIKGVYFLKLESNNKTTAIQKVVIN